MKPIPADAELMFIETAATGTVHIAVRYSAHDIGRSPSTAEVISGGAAFVAMAVVPTVTRCGKRTFPQFERDHVKNPRFHDEHLCRACYRTLAPQDQERAFEHAQPGDEDDSAPAEPAPAVLPVS
ncbi:hypothetical protein [Streptomyces scabiei]|uniref:hypothetical protein n=1 Tax=Streptomyces scabiei TaxID=1930 RepID=UPI0029B96391|nr:hypothetical protein [Streptomyces scabiei]MDX3520751.1 hypothetical protein [Streptomyces scabiei]